MTLIPMPKLFTENDAKVKLGDMSVILSPECDTRISKAALVLRREIEEKAGKKINFKIGAFVPGSIYIKPTTGNDDSYAIRAGTDGVVIMGAGLRGTFYGIQTIRQIIKLTGSDEISSFEIEDRPDFSDRGFYHDVTRGRVPTLETLKKLVDELAYLKISSALYRGRL